MIKRRLEKFESTREVIADPETGGVRHFSLSSASDLDVEEVNDERLAESWLYDDKIKTSAMRNHRYKQGLEATQGHGSAQDNTPASSKPKHGRGESVGNGSALVFGPLERRACVEGRPPQPVAARPCIVEPKNYSTEGNDPSSLNSLASAVESAALEFREVSQIIALVTKK